MTWETLVAFFRTSVLGTVALVVDTVREDEKRIVVVLLLVVFSVVFAFGREPQSYLLFGRDDTLITPVCFDGPSHTFYKRCKAIALLQSTHKQRALKPKGSADDTS